MGGPMTPHGPCDTKFTCLPIHQARGKVPQFNAGQTVFCPALEAAKACLKAAPAKTPVVVFMSDGAPADRNQVNACLTSMITEATANNPARRLTSPLQFHCVGFGTEID